MHDVKTPSLYKHVDGLADLLHRIAILSTTELGDAIRDATQCRAGSDAVAAAARAARRYITRHPGRYLTTVGAQITGPDDLPAIAGERGLSALAAVLHGYRLDPEREIHALRTLRSMLHGFLTLELAGGFQYATHISAGFTWMTELLNQGLRTQNRDTPRNDRNPRSHPRAQSPFLCGTQSARACVPGRSSSGPDSRRLRDRS